MSREETLKLNILRTKKAIKQLAESCNLSKNKWYKCECYFQVNENDVFVDNLIFKDADKVCRRKMPRFELGEIK